MAATAACVLTLTATGCDSVIYDSQDNCAYYVRFRYDYNMKFADAFHSEVKQVMLYVFDSQGKYVKTLTEPIEEIIARGNMMEITDEELQPGNYRFLAWAACNNGFRHFKVGEGTDIDDFRCRLERNETAAPAERDADCGRLYHGLTDNVSLSETYGDIIDMDLTKDTNVIHVALQQMSGEPMNPEEFEFRIVDTNGWMAHDNSLLPDNPIHYKPWSVKSAQVGDADFGRADAAITTVSGMVADLTVSRLIPEHRQSARLIITDTRDGEEVVNLPLIDVLLLVRGNYTNPVDDQPVSDREFLDREDDYELIFFLEDRRWAGASIYINSWHVVLQNAGV